MNSNLKEYICIVQDCNKIFNTKWSLKRHICTHQQNSKVSYSCDKCDKSFSRKDSLDRHYQLCHSNLQVMYMCSEADCGKIFSLRSTLYRHLFSHSASFTCKECGASFSRKDNLSRHRTIHTTKLTPQNVEPKQSLKEPIECSNGRGDHTYTLSAS